MTTPRPGSPQAPTPASIAKEMRVKGMNTAKIMIALFEMDIAMKDVMKTKNDVITNAFKADGEAARLRTKLETTVAQNVKHLGALANVIQDNIAKLGTVKTTVEISKNYGNQLAPFTQKTQALEAKNDELLKSQISFINELRKLMQEMAEAKNLSPSSDKANALQKLVEKQRDLSSTVRKLYEGKDFEILTKDLEMLANESERTTRAAGLKIGAAPTPGASPELKS